MNVTYVQSGYPNIYHYFDHAIVKALHVLGVSQQDSAFSVEQMIPHCLGDNPDLILTLLGTNLHSKTRAILKDHNIATAVWLTEDPYFIDDTIKTIFAFDYVFTIDSAAATLYDHAGHTHTYYLPLGTDPSIYKPVNSTCLKQYDLMLIGTPYPNRVKLIQKILTSSHYSILVVGKNWGNYLSTRKYPKLTVKDEWLAPNEVNELLPLAAIHLNPHRPAHLKQNHNKQQIKSMSINNRTFDIACAQQFQLIEHKADINQHFELKKEIVSYDDTNDLLAKISYYLKNHEEREQIAQNARKRVLSEHTFQHRIEKMITIIKQEIE